MEQQIKPNIQSNSLRGEYMHGIVDRTINEIQADIKGMLGPGASDAFIIKNDQPYYTRDGKEVMESLRFDNELAMYVHHILYQAVYNQGHNIGDGSTTLAVLYCAIYNEMRKRADKFSCYSINTMRKSWKDVIETIMAEIDQRTVKMTPDYLLSMLYTCTQDAELSARIYDKLEDAIMAGAYIIPRKSNINTDFVVNVYNQPKFSVTRQFAVRPVPAEVKDAVIIYCNGTISISHYEIFATMMAMHVSTDNSDPYNKKPLTFILLGHGVDDTTRRTLRKLMSFIKENDVNVSEESNVAIYTLDEYRSFDSAEIEDISTIINDEPGLGGLVNALTFEHLLYNAFNVSGTTEKEIPELERFDIDIHNVDKIKGNIIQPFTVLFDDIEGMTICKELGPNSRQRYDELRRQIDEEKSPVKKADLNKRLRRVYGLFIDIEVGSVLLKDSQRKFELILDAIVSSAEGVRDGVLVGNSLVHLGQIIEHSKYNYQEGSLEREIMQIIHEAQRTTLRTIQENVGAGSRISIGAKTSSLDAFNIYAPGTMIEGNIDDMLYSIDPTIVEPCNIIKAILMNSSLPMELAKTEVFHISGVQGFMGNYIE